MGFEPTRTKNVINVIKWDISLGCVDQQNTKKAREEIVNHSTVRKAKIIKFERSSNKAVLTKIAGQRKSMCYLSRVKMIES